MDSVCSLSGDTFSTILARLSAFEDMAAIKEAKPVDSLDTLFSEILNKFYLIHVALKLTNQTKCYTI